MALTNPKIFGLEVSRNLADVENTNAALRSLNLDIRDLDVIRGSLSAGMSENDWLSLSGLNVPIYKEIGRYFDDSSTAVDYLDERAGHEIILFGNLNINGALSGNAVRYRYVKGLGTNSRSFAIADISTSRISSWSSSANPVTNSSPISYGAQVKVSTGGKLQFGTQSGVSGNRIQTTLVPETKEFASEFPTHKIQTKIGGSTVNVYAMKGIPIVWTGFFRNLNVDIYLSSLTQNTKASWKVQNTANANDYTNFENVGSTHTYIRYRSSVSKERYIKFYYNPDKITSITLPWANLAELPPVKFNNATTLAFSNNKLTVFPDFTDLASSLTNLQIANNQFRYSEFPTERKLNSAIMNKIPTTVTNLYLGSTFGGSFDSDLIADRLTGLVSLNLQNYYGRAFTADNSTAVLPNVRNTTTGYYVYNNNFTTFDTSPSGSNVNILTATGLTNVQLHYNRGLTCPVTFTFASQVLDYFNISVTGLLLPDLNSHPTIRLVYAYHRGGSDTLFNGTTYKYDNCHNLQTLHLYNSWSLTGPFPQFNNAKLSYLDLRYCSMSGGAMNPNGTTDTTYVLPEFTFQNSPNITDFYWFSRGSSSLASSIHPNALSFLPKLYHIYWITWYRTPGPLPNLGSNPNLRYCRFPYNAFTGSCPTFQGNPLIYYVELQYNQLSGDIPAFTNLTNLYQLRLWNNNFTGIKTFENCTNLRYFWCHNNQITGEIPDFSGCPRLYYLVMYNNQFTSYKSGAFKNLTQIRYLTVNSNNLNQTSINNILEDLYDNYLASPRGGVTIDLRGNASPTGGASNEYIQILESKRWDIRQA